MTIKSLHFLLRKIVFKALVILTTLFFVTIISTISADDNNNASPKSSDTKSSDATSSDAKSSDTTSDQTTSAQTKSDQTKSDQTKTDTSQSNPKIKKQPILDEIRDLIQKLGDDRFVVRERASKRLLQIGTIAEPELRRAMKNNDVEIARRAELILSQLEQVLRDVDDEAVEIFIKIYTSETDPFVKLQCIWQLANPLPDAPCRDGIGLQSLCRITRSDRNKMMRNEAAKCLIALEPLTISKKEKWRQNIRRIFSRNGDDEILKLLYNYASLRIDISELREHTESDLENRAKKTGDAVEYPVKLPKSKELEERLKKFATDLNKFQSDPLYSKITPNHWIDILVFYAVAEMYDELNMNQERDKILENVLKIREQLNQKPLILLSELDNKEMSEHFRVSTILYHKQRLNWAERHLKQVIDNGYVILKIVACSEASMIRILMADIQGAIEYIEKSSEILKSEEYKKILTNSDERIKKNEIQILAYKAQLAAEKNDWKKTKELVDKTLEMDPHEIDTIILRHKICENNSDIDQAYKIQMRNIIEKATRNVIQEMKEQRINNEDTKPYVVACNQVAWLLANTNGEFILAKDLIDITIKNEPDSPTYLDTQSCVFALGKHFDKAIEIQSKTIKLSPESKLYKNALEKFKKLKNETTKGNF